MKKETALALLLLLVVGVANAQNDDGFDQIRTIRRVESFDGLVLEEMRPVIFGDLSLAETPTERYTRAMREIGNWNINLFPVAVIAPEPKDWLEEEEWFGLERISLRSMIPRRYRPLRFEAIVGHQFGKNDAWTVELVGFESRTNLRYFEVTEEDKKGKKVRVSNDRAIGWAVLISFNW